MQPATLPQIQQWKTKKRYGIFLKFKVKTAEERQCFLMSPCQWGRSSGYSCMWICFNIYLSIIYFIWCMVRYTMRRTHVPPNVTRSRILWGPQRSPELAFRSTDFCVAENLIFPALFSAGKHGDNILQLFLAKTKTNKQKKQIKLSESFWNFSLL